MNSASTVEELLDQVAKVDPTKGDKSFTLWVPGSLTFQGSPVGQDVAMAVVLDRLLDKGFFPDGFVAEGTGRRYNYRCEGS